MIEPILTYEELGFDKYLVKSILPKGETANVAQSSLNFDKMQVSGGLGDVIQIGNILIDGLNRRIVVKDNNGNDAVVIGEL